MRAKLNEVEFMMMVANLLTYVKRSKNKADAKTSIEYIVFILIFFWTTFSLLLDNLSKITGMCLPEYFHGPSEVRGLL